MTATVVSGKGDSARCIGHARSWDSLETFSQCGLCVLLENWFLQRGYSWRTHHEARVTWAWHATNVVKSAEIYDITSTYAEHLPAHATDQRRRCNELGPPDVESTSSTSSALRQSLSKDFYEQMQGETLAMAGGMSPAASSYLGFRRSARARSWSRR